MSQKKITAEKLLVWGLIAMVLGLFVGAGLAMLAM
jgi:uncharacterized protein involved in exopolysaccharide biosynthesis